MRSISFALNDKQLPIRLNSEARATHMHVLGISGTGKTSFLEHMVRQDILAGHGVTIIDPHGGFYDNTVNWILSKELHKERTIHLLNPSDTEHTFGFNPLSVNNGSSLNYRVDAMVDAIVRAWGGGSLSETPRLAKCLTAVLHVLAENGLSLADAGVVTKRQYRDKANDLVEFMNNDVFRDLWLEWLDVYSDKMFAEYFESTESRLVKFLGDPIIHDIMCQTENVIDFQNVMDNNEIVLVNLAKRGKISGESARTLGALLVNDLYSTAFNRNEALAKYRPHYLYIDECYDYLTDDIVRALDETRKFGLHLVLSHQRTGQLRDCSEYIYNGVMAGAQLKVVFNPNDTETANTLSDLFFSTTFDLEMPKESMLRPTVVGYNLEWHTVNTTSMSVVEGSGEGEASGFISGFATSQLHGLDGADIGGYTTADSTSDTSVSSFNRFSAHGESNSYSESPMLMPELATLPTQLYTLEEMRHLGMTAFLKLQKREAWVCSPWLQPFRINTTDIQPGILSDNAVRIGTKILNEKSSYVQKRDAVQIAYQQKKRTMSHYDANLKDMEKHDDLLS